MNVIAAISCAAIETKLRQEAYLMMLRGLPHDASRVDVLGIEKKMVTGSCSGDHDDLQKWCRQA